VKPLGLGSTQNATDLGRTFRRLEVCLGRKKAAVSHKILVLIYHLLTEGPSYEEARDDPLRPTQEAREQQRAVKALERLGDVVTVERAA
jgi:hypothetical protein